MRRVYWVLVLLPIIFICGWLWWFVVSSAEGQVGDGEATAIAVQLTDDAYPGPVTATPVYFNPYPVDTATPTPTATATPHWTYISEVLKKWHDQVSP